MTTTTKQQRLGVWLSETTRVSRTHKPLSSSPAHPKAANGMRFIERLLAIKAADTNDAVESNLDWSKSLKDSKAPCQNPER